MLLHTDVTLLLFTLVCDGIMLRCYSRANVETQLGKVTHQEFLRHIDLNAPPHIGMHGELTEFLCRMILRQSAVLLQISY